MTSARNRRSTMGWMGAVLGALVACAAPAAAQTRYAPGPVVLLVMPHPANGARPSRLRSLTRHPSGRIYLTAWDTPAAVFTPGTFAGSYLRTVRLDDGGRWRR